MFKLSFIILFFCSVLVTAQSPHGEEFDLDCENCHTSENWIIKFEDVKFEHSKTSFPLVGQHQAVSCRSCHSSLIFSDAKSQCFTCHKDMHSNTVGIDCARCHESTSWLVRNINILHQSGRFPLVGKHLNARCEQCHTQINELKFPPLSVRCFDCHSNDYYSAKLPDHAAGNFSTECQDCHNLTDAQWNMTHFAHDFFPLVGGHNLKNCFDCHQQNKFTGLTKECITCHRSDYDAVKNPDHIAAGFPTKCESCHNINSWQQANFDHNLTGFPLTGLHINVQCSTCHQNGYANISTECYSCHKSVFDNAQNPNHVTGGFPTSCNTCHNINGWRPASFDHNITQFPLTGIHSTTQCSSCHQSGYSNISTECYSCHKSSYDNSTDPNHVSVGFPTDCQSCHTTTGWKPATFDHDGKYFPIYTGKHNGKWNVCSDCHTNNSNYAIFSCTTCHEHNQTDMNSKHQGIQGYSYSSDACFNCHPQGNSEGSFNHATSAFPLTGAHITVNCANCHTSGYSGTPTNCVSCHQAKYNSTTNPNHSSLSLSTDCSTCHTTNAGWKPAQFPIHSNYFAFTGAHTTISNDCAGCHNGNYTNTSKTCVGCHQTNYNSTTNPSHTSLSLSTDCNTCHTTNAGWKPAQFPIHSNYFAFTGAHTTISNDCVKCHNGNYTNTSSTCVGCHQTNYNSTTNPNHAAAGFPTDCQSCHTTTGWQPATFDHDGKYFPIYTGKHNGKWNVCSDCHTNNSNYAIFSCTTCHEHNQTDMNSKHQGIQGYSYSSDACFNCHPKGDNEGSFNHATSAFPLTGAHITVNCANCHTSGYSGTPTNCVSCHQAKYNSTTNPNHSSLSISTDCITCHTTNAGWKPAQFPVHSNYFALTGAHTAISNDCAGCHNGNYTNTSKTCVGCHQTNYNSTTNPNHTSAGFPTDCQSCHTTTGWKPATFDHDGKYFPIYTGKHNGKWNVCSDCHTNNSNYAIFSCTTCHEHNQTDMNNEHQGLQGYSYSSDACFNCHPKGDSEGSFNHATSAFPLTGAHTTVNCANCHTSGYSGTPTNCVSCHQAKFNSTANPNHTSLSLSTDCSTCHTTNAGWKPAQFPVHNNYFALTGAHATISNDCASCHNGNYTNTSKTCVGCHQTNYNSTSNPDHTTLGLSTDCSTCHTTNAGWKPAQFPIHSNYFALTGAHTTISNDCAGCHNGNYTNTSKTCVGCHQSNYNSTSNPNHTTLGLSTDCSTCHTTNAGWKPAQFPVHSNYFALTGAHTAISNDCAGCHNGNYTNTSETCVGCHQTNYNSTTNPNHTAAGFPTDCQSCHNTTGWQPATFNHDGQFFPIYSGRHRNEWTLCSDCHKVSTNFSVFSCIDCHEHNKTSTDSHHNDVSGYSYVSTECYRCHPNGNSDIIKMLPRLEK